MVLVYKDINQRFNINTYHNNLIKNRGINIYNSVKQEITEEIKKDINIVTYDIQNPNIIKNINNNKILCDKIDMNPIYEEKLKNSIF